MRFTEFAPSLKGAVMAMIALGLTACADTNDVSVPESSVTKPAYESPVTFISPMLGCHQGYTTDGTNHYIFDTGRIFVRSNDADWTIIRANYHPFTDITNVAHLGDGDYYDGKLYVVAEDWRGCDNFSNQSILVFNAATLARLNVISVSNQNHEVSGLVVVPEHGKNGTIYVTSFCDGTRIFKYDLKTFAYLGAMALQTPIPMIQGITYHSNAFYIPSDPGSLYTVDMSGSVKWLYNSTTKGSHEGLAYWQGTLRWLIDQGNGNSHVHYLHFPGFEEIPVPSAQTNASTSSTNSSDRRTKLAQ